MFAPELAVVLDCDRPLEVASLSGTVASLISVACLDAIDLFLSDLTNPDDGET